MGGLGGDIGARDPTAGEIESGFTSKVLGHADTDHILQVPTEMSDMVKIVNKTCVADGAYAEKLDFQGQEVLRKQVWDWKIRPGRAHFECLRREFTVRDGEAENFVALVKGVCDAEGWPAATAEATSAEEREMFRAFARRCRETLARRLVERCYGRGENGERDKFWMAFAKRRFLNRPPPSVG